MKIRNLLERYGSLATTALVCALLYLTAGTLYDGFFSARVFFSFFSDNAFLGIVAIGMTFVILSGGIDLSVGAIVGAASILMATLIEIAGWHPLTASLLVLLLGTTFGAVMGGLIHRFLLPPFIVTLAGMFLARGIGFVIHTESIAIQHPLFLTILELPRNLATKCLPTSLVPIATWACHPTTLIFLTILALGIFLAHSTRFGRCTYAIGGDENSAQLMGLPVGSTKIKVYAFSGFCSALAGIVYTLYTFAGNPTSGTMLELDAIAAVVIGGTMLTGGVGYVAGTLFGVLIFGIIQTAITFDGTLSSWWTRITIGFLLLIFILLQRLFQHSLNSTTKAD